MSSGNSTADYAGNNSARQSIGLPGHCDECARVGHVAAHPDLGCGDVECTREHVPEDDLTTRLLAEIERRERHLVDCGTNFGFRELSHITKNRAYLVALRKVVEIHFDDWFVRDDHFCGECGRPFPCPTVAAVAEALGVTP